MDVNEAIEEFKVIQGKFEELYEELMDDGFFGGDHVWRIEVQRFDPSPGERRGILIVDSCVLPSEIPIDDISDFLDGLFEELLPKNVPVAVAREFKAYLAHVEKMRGYADENLFPKLRYAVGDERTAILKELRDIEGDVRDRMSKIYGHLTKDFAERGYIEIQLQDREKGDADFNVEYRLMLPFSTPLADISIPLSKFWAEQMERNTTDKTHECFMRMKAFGDENEARIRELAEIIGQGDE